MSFKMLSYLPDYLMKNLLLKMQPCTTEANVCVKISTLQKTHHWKALVTITGM